MTIASPNETFLRLIRNKGNQRLWLLAAAIWLLFAGVYFWKPLPQYRIVDVSGEISNQCEFEANSRVGAAEERAYHLCLEKRGDGGTASEPPSAATKSMNESACELERFSAAAAEQEKSGSHLADCMLEKLGPAQKAAQPEADRIVGEARSAQLSSWAAIVFLPPLLAPLAIALALYAAWLVVVAAKWVGEGYKPK